MEVMTGDARRIRGSLTVITQSLVADPSAAEVGAWVLDRLAARVPA
jgi:hypothetical protein